MLFSRRSRILPVYLLPAALVILAAFLICCSHSGQGPEIESAECKVLAGRMAEREADFVAKVKAIRVQHVSLREYDRQMIAVLLERRTALQATTLTEMSVVDEVAGCTGKPLDDMRRHAQEEIINLRAYLNDFKRALQTDPEGIFVDQY